MPGIFHVLQPASLDSALAGVEEPEDEVPADCSRMCWRKAGGALSCTCDDYDQDGTTEGGW